MINDEKDLLPPEYRNTKKNIFKEIRKLFKKTENDSIEEEVRKLTDLKSIKEDLFGSMGDSDNLVVRIYVKHNVNEKNFFLKINQIKIIYIQ